MEKKMNETSYDIGYEAFFEGKEVSDNPFSYENDLKSYGDWEQGWYGGLAYSEYEEQQYRTL